MDTGDSRWAVLDLDLPDAAAEDSHNLLPLLLEEKYSVRTTHVHNTRRGEYAIRHGDWLLVDAKSGYVSGRNKAWEEKRGYRADDGAAVELYNLKEDVGQKENVAAKHPATVGELQVLLKKIQTQGHSAPRLAD